MSKATKSTSKSRSRSRSRSRSVSRSRSPSRSRSRKHRYSSRSRSRSRSHSPPHNWEKKYPRGYQNNREYRGYHRGFRRPYYFRGRGRGYFPRGRFQRGGGGGYNNNFRFNWQNYRQYPQQQQQQQQQHQPNKSRGRSRIPKKRSGSPPPHSHSDRSSSPRSRHSHHSSSSSHSSSPKLRSAPGLVKQSPKDAKEELLASKEVQRGRGNGESMEVTGVSAGVEDGTAEMKIASKWQGLTDYSTSPKRASPPTGSAVIGGHTTATTNQSSSSPKNTDANSNGAPPWQSVGPSSFTQSPSQKSSSPKFPSFGFFSKEDHLVGDKAAISTAFKKFWEERNNKNKQTVWENGKNTEANDLDVEQDIRNEKVTGGIFDAVSKKYKEDFDSHVSLNSLLKASPFLSGDGEEEEEDEVTVKPRSKSHRRDCDNGDKSSKPKSKVTRSARELFEERFSKWEDLAYLQVAKDDDLDAMAEEIYRSRKQDKAAAIAAVLAKRELAGMLRDLSPERGSKARKKKSSSSPPPSPPVRRNADREMFTVRGEDSPPTASWNRETTFNVRMGFLGDTRTSSSDVLAGERQLSQDLVHPSKKEQEFRSIFQHVKAPQLQRTPSELFAEHIVTIVHHIKAQHFPSSGMTLNERFAMYQRRAAEKEMTRPRKSPEIHRRIDVSPSAFTKHSHLFEAMKSSEDGSYKDGGKKVKGNSMDLRLDIERRKKYSAREKDYNHDGGRDVGDSPESSRERSVEKSSKRHKKSKKSKKKRSRSSSSSSSSSSKSRRGREIPHNDSESKDEGFNKARLGQRDFGVPVDRGRSRGGFQFKIRGRGWNRGTCHGNNTNSIPLNLQARPLNEDWDPEYTPKSKKYYLHDDRKGEGESRWTDNRGRGRGGAFLHGRARFIIRRDPATPGGNNSLKWTHDKYQVNGEQQETRDRDAQQDHKDRDEDRDHENT